MLDGNPRLDIGSFVATWMEPECDKLMMASINKNYIGMDQYPITTELQVSLFPFDLYLDQLILIKLCVTLKRPYDIKCVLFGLDHDSEEMRVQSWFV